MDLTKLTQADRIVLVAGVLLIVNLLFLPWHHIDLGGSLGRLGLDVTGVDTSFSRSGVQSPNAAYGLLAVIVAAVMVGQVAASKLFGAQLPDPPAPWSQIHFIAGCVVLALLVIKLLAETTALGFGSYLGVLLAAALAFGGYSMRQAEGVGLA